MGNQWSHDRLLPVKLLKSNYIDEESKRMIAELVYDIDEIKNSNAHVKAIGDIEAPAVRITNIGISDNRGLMGDHYINGLQLRKTELRENNSDIEEEIRTIEEKYVPAITLQESIESLDAKVQYIEEKAIEILDGLRLQLNEVSSKQSNNQMDQHRTQCIELIDDHMKSITAVHRKKVKEQDTQTEEASKANESEQIALPIPVTCTSVVTQTDFVQEIAETRQPKIADISSNESTPSKVMPVEVTPESVDEEPQVVDHAVVAPGSFRFDQISGGDETLPDTVALEEEKFETDDEAMEEKSKLESSRTSAEISVLEQSSHNVSGGETAAIAALTAQMAIIKRERDEYLLEIQRLREEAEETKLSMMEDGKLGDEGGANIPIVATGPSKSMRKTKSESVTSKEKELENQVTQLKQELKLAQKQSEGKQMESTSSSTKLKNAEQSVKELRGKCNRLEKELAKAEARSGGGADAGKASLDMVKLKKELTDQSKKFDKKMEEVEKSNRKQVNTLESRVASLEEELRVQKEANETASKAASGAALAAEELLAAKKRTDDLELENTRLRQVADEHASLTKTHTQLEAAYMDEQKLRKKYYNMMEDMKGKIRVFARCRPMAAYEIEKNSEKVVAFRDEYSVGIGTTKGTKEFVFDRCFTPESTQEEVFEDTQNLIQSSLDGYNVCVFAYGQTGSGKTHTMVGSQDHPGLVLRTIQQIFQYKNENADRNVLSIKLNMMELYLDNLVDLLHPVLKGEGKVQGEPAKLDIKKDNSGVVFVKGAHTITIESEAELISYFNKANAVRKVGSTKMNAGSSRSHLVFTLTLENYDKNTKKQARGKLSLVDLAGSERQDKTGATDERLKEAMSINKSLSALGDVISALSSGESFIPYRNNKLTQLMSDSLGGNAKTLMFVNISPADYNTEETLSSLSYASRVKQITNNANKTDDSEQIAYFKRVIDELVASGGVSKTLEQKND